MTTQPSALLFGRGLALATTLTLVGCGGSKPPEPGAATPAPASRGLPAAAPGAAPLAQEIAEIVDTYRKIIVLLENERGLEPEMQRRANVVGRILYQENHERLGTLTHRLTDEAIQGAAPAPPAVTAFLDVLETGPDLHDADKLVFRDTVDELADAVRTAKNPAKAALLTRLEDDQKALKEIQALYEKELEKIFGRFETRGMTVRREAWENYVAFLKMKFRPEAILAEYEERAKAIQSPKSGARGDFEISGTKLPPKTLVLTFDDGPHPRYTDRILEILKRFKVKAVFFEVGRNLGTVGKDGGVQAVRTADASRRLLEAGFPLANHSFTHALLPKLTDAEIAREIELTNRMLKEVSKTDTILFRPPYGARDDRVLAAIQGHRMKSILWNIDSKDWADPVPKSIANRAIATVEGEGRGILLFHDIQGRTVEALPMVLETLQARGYRFLTWNGSAFIDEAPPAPAVAEAPRPSLYRESWAVVVGVDEYKSWPRLQYAVSDARAVRELLVSKYQFKPENVTLLLDQEATREKILAALGDRLADGEKVKKDDRVFVFFAGHGITRKLPNGRNLGYIVPVEADTANYQSQAISMTNFQDVSEAIPAKHVFYVMDACYSGVALTRGGAAVGQNYLAEVTRRVVRQMLTAGGADEQVADNGPSGHSIFTWTLLQGLEGRADLNGDGYIMASELASYVGPTVASLSKQTPAFGSLVGSEGGEFVFELKHENEFLSDVSQQLETEGIQLNAELDRVRAEIAAKKSRNEQLKQELARAKAELAGGGPAPTQTAASAQRNDKGTALFREKKYDEALREFQEAVKLAPASALAANNLGFTYFKLGRFPESVQWFEKALALDPARAIAHANLGDALVALGRKPEAKVAFEKYLELQPTARYADEVRKKLAALN
jgi:peptidoglycan/xylan/chitin deacetylase (PgdA/CDA1 family)/uncharacterized caspase-like protein